jgi:hypothetical protein
MGSGMWLKNVRCTIRISPSQQKAGDGQMHETFTTEVPSTTHNRGSGDSAPGGL